MKTFLKFTVLSAVLLMLAGGLASCNNREDPVEIPFTEFSLVETSCHWVNLAHDNRVIIINSDEHLKNHINCLVESFPGIDFSEYTLLLVSGTAHQNIVSMNFCLTRHSAGRYRLNVEIHLGAGDAMEPWAIALLAGKINNSSRINMNIQTIYN